MNTYTPKGDLKFFQDKASVLDFAFAIHSELAYRCTGALVDGVTRPLEHLLSDGSTVELLTSRNQHPKRGWYTIVHTQKARRGLDSFDWHYIQALEHKIARVEYLERFAEDLDAELEALREQVRYLHTKVLLKKLADTRTCSWQTEYDDLDDSFIVQRRRIHEMLKTELASREHVPNKNESKVIRLREIRHRNPRNRGGRR